jgi:REP element-mobilizing transposase RayT
MPYISAWFHYVWSTKNREPLLTSEVRPKVFEHIIENARKKDIYIDCINGHLEHAHCLISLSSDQTIAKIAQLIKGESSFWINKKKIIHRHFEWQDEYFAVSVSKSQLDKVRAYIHNQEKHHEKKTFQDECNEFMKQYNFPLLPGNTGKTY